MSLGWSTVEPSTLRQSSVWRESHCSEANPCPASPARATGSHPLPPSLLPHRLMHKSPPFSTPLRPGEPRGWESLAVAPWCLPHSGTQRPFCNTGPVDQGANGRLGDTPDHTEGHGNCGGVRVSGGMAFAVVSVVLGEPRGDILGTLEAPSAPVSSPLQWKSE